jgi:acetyl esterase/lipase
MKPVCGDLARRGIAAWNVEYRRMGRGQGGGFPATFDDVAAAIDHLAHVAHGRVDLGNVALLGHSAGGQLALWAASRQDGGVPVRLVVAQAPVTDMRTAEVARELLGGGPEQVPDRYAAVNPMQLIPPGMPVRIVHGADDATIPLFRSRRYVDASRAAGGDVELVEPVPGNHRVHIDPRSAAWAAAAEFLMAGT